MHPHHFARSFAASLFLFAAMVGAASQTVLDLSKGSIVITDTTVSGYAQDGSAVTIPNLAGGYKIIQSVLDSTTNTITVGSTSATKANPLLVTLSGINIRLHDGTEYGVRGTPAFTINGYTQVTLENDNYIQSGLQQEGIKGGLILTGAGSLQVYGGYEARGMTTATINGGNILVYGGYDCTGIGYAEINGGVVTAYGGYDAAALGGDYGQDGSVTINGGVVTANGGYGAPGLGAGANNNASSTKPIGYVTITGGIVNSFGGYDAAGIGGGTKGSGHVTITGGTIFGGSSYIKSIGTGIGGDSSIIKIDGGSINAFTLYTAADSNGVAVYRTVIANLEPNAFVTALNIPNYGTKDIKTSTAGDIVVYLPAGAVSGTLSTSHINYSFDGNAKDTLHATVTSVTKEYMTSQAPIVVGSENWYKGSVVIKPIPTSGYTKIGYADGSGAVTTWLDSLVITAEAVDAVATFRLKDGAGALSPVRTLTYSLDMTAPTGTLTVGGVTDEIDSLAYQLYSRDTLTFTVGGIADGSSGVAKSEFYVCNYLASSCNVPQSCVNGDVIKVAPTHLGYMVLRVTDVAGNQNTITSKKFFTLKDATIDTTAITINQDSLPTSGGIQFNTTLNGLALQRVMLGKYTFPPSSYFVNNNNGQVQLYNALLSALPAGKDTLVLVFAPTVDTAAPDKYLSKPTLAVTVIPSASSVLSSTPPAPAFHIAAAPFGIVVASDRSIAIAIRNLRGEVVANMELHQGFNAIHLERGVYIIGNKPVAVIH